MLSKRYESTEVDRRAWLHVPSGTLLSTSSDEMIISTIVLDFKNILLYVISSHPWFDLSNLESHNFSFVLDHIDYVKNYIGVDYVGIGADYDGIPT